MFSAWIWILIYLCLACLLEGISYSHLGSFYNTYAKNERSLSAFQFGIVLGSYSVVVLIVTPVTAKLVAARCFKDKTILCVGLMIDAAFTIFMAGASNLTSGTLFFTFCLFMRVVQAIGRASAVLMIYVIAGSQLENINHIVIPLLEIIYGVSVVLGPMVSGFLFELGGFPLPFIAIGGILLVFSLSATCAFPDTHQVEKKIHVDEDDEEWSLWNASVIVNALACCHAFYLISFNESTLAVQLEQDYTFSSSMSGLVFFFSGVSYAASGLLSGYFSKRVSDPRHIVLLGLLVATFALCLLGHVIPVPKTFWLTCVAQSLLGLGSGPIFVCCYLQSLRHVGGASPKKNMYASLMALFNPATSIGCMLGPIFSGFMLDHSSYASLAALNALLTLLVLLALMITACCVKPKPAMVLPDPVRKC